METEGRVIVEVTTYEKGCNRSYQLVAFPITAVWDYQIKRMLNGSPDRSYNVAAFNSVEDAIGVFQTIVSKELFRLKDRGR